jgi:hypothetical protein
MYSTHWQISCIAIVPVEIPDLAIMLSITFAALRMLELICDMMNGK